MNVEATAQELAERANKCCGRSDGYEEDMQQVIAGTLRPLVTALEAAEQALETLRRGHGVEVSATCYPALNLVRQALGR